MYTQINLKRFRNMSCIHGIIVSKKKSKECQHITRKNE